MTQFLTQRFEAAVSAISTLFLIAPLVLASALFLASSI